MSDRMQDPSKVIHIRNVPGGAAEHDIHDLAQQFGPIQRLVLVRSKNQALLQMQDLEAATALINFFQDVQPTVRGQKVYVQYSSHQELTSQEPSQQRQNQDQEPQPNRILLVTIHNPLFPINVDVLQQVFSPHGFVEKCVTFYKSAGLQALLQYQNQSQATQARSNLQGRNIYDGCCTLDIQFSNLQELQVNYNNERTRDFTNTQLPEGGSNGRSPNQQGSLFGDGGSQPQQYGGHGGGRGGERGRGGYQQQGSGQGMSMGGYQGGGGGGGMSHSGAAAAASFGPGGLPPGLTGTNDRSTMLVSNFEVQEMDADKLFNLISNYGNVIRIKILHNKPDHALIQMADPFQAELAVHHLKGVVLFGKKLEVNYSRHPNISPSPETHEFGNSNLNRFTRNPTKNYRHCCAPTRMIHCSSLPTDVTSEALTEHLAPHGTISGCKIVDRDNKKQALVLFSTPEEATEALVCKHAQPFGGSNLRIAFSKMTSVE